MASSTNTNNVQSIALDLENLSQEYNSVLNFFNSVQSELNSYIASPHPPNPYANTNIKFTTGQICYVTKNGVAKLYQDIAGAYSLTDDQNAINQTISTIGNYENTMGNLQNQRNSILSERSTVDGDLAGLLLVPFAGPELFAEAEVLANITFDIELDTVKGQISSDRNMINQYNSQLNNQQNQLVSDQQILNSGGCPLITQFTQVNLPWLQQYNNPGQIIPTTPPIITGTPMTGTEVSQGLNCNNINAGNPPPPIDLITVPNSSYTGGSPIGTVYASNSQECMTYCYTSPSCTGATYNSQNNMCSLSSGDGSITNSTNNNTAIVPQLVQYLDVMIVLNTRLTNINNQILNVTDQGQPIYNNLTAETTQKKKELSNVYNKLTAERDRIEKMVAEYSTLQDDEDNNINVINSNYLSYILLLALAILVIIVLMNIGGKSTTTNQYGGGSLNKFTHIIIFVIVLVSFIMYVLYSNKK